MICHILISIVGKETEYGSGICDDKGCYELYFRLAFSRNNRPIVRGAEVFGRKSRAQTSAAAVRV